MTWWAAYLLGERDLNPNHPREGNRPGQPTSETRDPPEPSCHSLVRKLESGLAEPLRDTLHNRYLAACNGWSEEEFEHWVATGDTPNRTRINEAATPPVNPADDERLYDDNRTR